MSFQLRVNVISWQSLERTQFAHPNVSHAGHHLRQLDGHQDALQSACELDGIASQHAQALTDIAGIGWTTSNCWGYRFRSQLAGRFKNYDVPTLWSQKVVFYNIFYILRSAVIIFHRKTHVTLHVVWRVLSSACSVTNIIK